MTDMTFTDRNYQGALVTHTVAGKLVFQSGIVRVLRLSATRLTVCYGLAVKTNLSHTAAAKFIGYAILHQVECAGLLD